MNILNRIFGKKAGSLAVVKEYSKLRYKGSLYLPHYELTSLKGCPTILNYDFSCVYNYLTSFEHFPKRIGWNCYISGNKLITSFKDIDKHIEYIGSKLCANDMNITSGYSDLFGIDGLQEIQIGNLRIEDKATVDIALQNIVNKHLPTKDLINFQDEIIKSGFESYL